MELLTDKIIDKNMLSRVDSEVNHYQVLTELNDHKKGCSAIAKVYGLIHYSNCNLHRKRKHFGWKLLVEWKDGSVDWVPLKDLKPSNPSELDKYAVEN